MVKNSNRYRFISIDGKAVRNSFDKFMDKKAKHILYAFLRDDKLVLAHEEVTKDKTNEIPKMQEMIEELKLDMKNVVFTADAMHCQEDTMKEVSKGGYDFILQVKGNQKKLLEECQRTANNRRSIDESKTIDKNSGRVEERKVRVFENVDFLDRKWKKYVKVIIKVERKRRVLDSGRGNHEDSYDESYYLCAYRINNFL